MDESSPRRPLHERSHQRLKLLRGVHTTRLAVAITFCGVLIAGCGGGSSTAGSSTANGTATATNSAQTASAGNSAPRIEFVAGEPETEEFHRRMAAGMHAAAEQLGVTANYDAVGSVKEANPGNMARLLKGAIASHPDGLVVSDFAPDALNPIIKEATESGIPTIIVNQGEQYVQATGALSYTGEDEVLAGEAFGKAMTQRGIKNLLWVSVPPESPASIQRDEGVEKGFKGKLTIIRVKYEDPTGVRNAIQAAVLKDPSIEGVGELFSGLAPAMLAARGALGARGEEITWGSVDISESVLQAMVNKEIAFTTDQQPYLQGYYPILELQQYLSLGLKPQSTMLTGPVIIEPDEAQRILELSKEGTR